MNVEQLAEELAIAKTKQKLYETQVALLTKRLEALMVTECIDTVEAAGCVISLKVKQRKQQESTLLKKNPQVIEVNQRLQVAQQQLLDEHADELYEYQLQIAQLTEQIEDLSTNDAIQALQDELKQTISNELAIAETYYEVTIDLHELPLDDLLSHEEFEQVYATVKAKGKRVMRKTVEKLVRDYHQLVGSEPLSLIEVLKYVNEVS